MYQNMLEKNTITNKMTTHSCIAFVIIMAQCFGMMPVCGITSSTPNGLKFCWGSRRTIYSIIFTISASLNTFFQLLKIVKGNFEFTHFVTLLFFLCTVITVVIFIDLAKKWPKLMERWTENDDLMGSYGFPKHLKRKITIITVVIMSSAIIEHSLFLFYTFDTTPKRDDIGSTIQLYLTNRYDHIFNIIPYDIILGIYVQLLNMFSTFCWNFMDLFIIIISLCLSSRFKQIADLINIMTRRRILRLEDWRKIREDYTRLAILCETVDDNISNIILISFANNLFIIIVQLFNSLSPDHNHIAIEKVYFLYSFGFLILRTVAVALYASTIDSESRKPCYMLSNLKFGTYNSEIERFIYQLKYNTCALTGHKLFKVKKSLLLSVAGAIVSYELILFQFHYN